MSILPLTSGPRRRFLHGFTLIELLVVISIIALLIGILLPALTAARVAAQRAKSLSNVRQIGIAMSNFLINHDGRYPWAAADMPSEDRPHGTKPRWADYIRPFIDNDEVFISPAIDLQDSVLSKKWWHEATDVPAHVTFESMAGPFNETSPAPEPAWGGYGYNWQYLGNGRSAVEFRLRDIKVKHPSDTLLVGDTTGQLSDPGGGTYVLDPILGSTRGGGDGLYYHGSAAEDRAAPADRYRGTGTYVFADGHAQAMSRDELDDFNGDGVTDNGYWNGRGDADPATTED